MWRIDVSMPRMEVMKFIAYVRIFTVFAIAASGLADLYASGIFDTPIEQIGMGAVAGLAATIFFKMIHFV